MRDEADIMDELQELHGELKAFPQDAHWFCPKRNDEDYADYSRADEDEEDVSAETKKERIQDAKKRHAVAYKYSLVTGLAADVGGAMIEEYTGGLNKLLRSCDKCVHNWHLGRKAYLKELAEQFDEDMVAELSNRLLAIDFQRIDSGLKASQKVIEEAEPQMRTQKLLAGYDSALLLSLYESLCSIEYHKSEKNLSKHFNFVFEEIQSKKVLRISDILPATGRFLFDSNAIRLRFARCAWQKTTGMLTPELFDWVVHDTLSGAVTFVAQNNHDYDAIIRFWEGFSLILERLDDRLITYSLRAMEVQPSVYLLALQHLTCKSEAIVQLVIEALRKLLKKSPKSFWAAFNTISPATVAEQIFMSPTYDQLLGRLHEYGAADTSFILGWIPEFIISLPADHQFDVCGSFLYNLLERLQNDKYQEHTRLACCCAGLDALRATLETFVDSNYNINPSTSLIIINNVMALVDTYKGMILGSIELRENGHNQVEMRRLSMLVTRDALALDCKALSAEFQALVKNIPIQQGLRGHSQPIWQAVLDIFRPGNVDLAKTILSATSHLTGLDELRPKDKKQATLPASHMQYNKDFRQLTENVSRIFERLSDFDASDLVQMYQDSQTSRPLFAALVSADQQIYEAAVEVVKASTGQISKRDAISSLLELTFVPMMNSVTYAITRIAKARNFSPMPYMIKIGRDMVYSLCDTTGYLRSHTSLSNIEKNAVMTWWITQWRALDVMFSTTEEWGMRVQRSKEDMQDFCRDGMEYAESLFNQYRIIASAIGATSDSGDDQVSARISSKDAIQKVLQVVCQNVNGLTMMLRLRDTYLVGVITSLLATLLKSLAEFDTEVDKFALEYIQDACKDEDEKGFRRTNLSKQQKADLRAALDEHKGFEIMQTLSFVAPKKQATIDSWSKSAGGVKHEPTFNFKERQMQSSLDAWSKSGDGKKYEPGSSTQSSRTSSLSDSFPKLSEKQRLLMEQVKAKQVKSQEASESLMARRRKDAEEKKQRDAAAIAQARALRAPTALVKGEGSGLKGISGVAGKDHAPTRSEIMIGSSDEDSDDDDDDDDSGTNLLATRSREANKKVSEYEESRRRNLLQATGPVKKTKRQHSKKDLRARVEPNMDIIYLEILNWDIFHQGDEPPTDNVCKKIANSFLDLNLYKETFKPLLISEVWRSLVTAKEENNYKPIETKVLNRLSVDKFMEVSTSIPLSTSRDVIMFERDIVLLSKSPNPLQDETAPHCLAQVSRRTRKKDVMEVTYKVSRDVGATLLQCFVPNGTIHALKIADMTTTLREFAALSSLEYYDLCTEILEAKPSPLQKYSEEKVASISTRYKLNKGQAKAILSANDNDGFTLIQGPPGSGKTKTIVAMVGSLLTQALQQQAQQTGVRPQGQKGAAATQPPKKKLLICAPSNAAVDELVLRLMEGILPLNGSHQKIKVVRLGRSDAINASVKDVTLDELVRIKLEGDMESKKGQLTDREMLHKEAGAIKERLNILRAEMESCRANNDKTSELKHQREFDELKRKQAHIGNKIDEDKNSDTKARASDLTRRQFTKEIIDEAHVLCSTLSGSGHETLLKLDNVEFETVIIDEAAQCIELSAIIPLKYGATKCILVGDPEQLPPTVLSRQAKSFGYEQSLFVRMQHNHPNDVHLLDTQYRMHPEISRFPSQQFYNSRLLDGDGMARLRAQPWHASSILGPYRFFDVEGIQSKEAKGHSFINVPELNAALRLYERLRTDYRSYDFKGKIGIITTYKAQLNELKNRFQRKYGEGIFEEIEFNTTDAFQGREREIIIFSCVRAQATGGIGFLNDIRRMNVGLTRAKSSLWVLGDSRALEQGQFWSKLIHDARNRNRYTSGDIMGLLARPTSNDAPPPDFSNPVPVLSDEPFADNVNVDVDMPDAPARSAQGSSSSSTPAASVDQTTTPTDSNPGDSRKRHRDRGSVDETVPTKKKKNQTPDVDVALPSNLRTDNSGLGELHRPAEKKVDLAAALEAQQASKASAAAARPNPPPPPRRKAPTDPFIQRKPPKRR